MDAKNLDALYAAHVEELQRRYARVLEDHGVDAIAIHSGAAAKRTRFDDQFWPLRPVPHWQHWVPLAEPGDVLVVTATRRPRLLRASDYSFWERRAAPETTAFLDLFDVETTDDVWRDVPRTGVAVVSDDADVARSLGPDAQGSTELLQALDALRVLKTPYEIACVAEANRRARAGHEALRRAFRESDGSELDLHLLYLKATAQDDWETPYKNIVSLGANAATLHHVAYGRTTAAREAESLLVDAGATCRGYCADVTRTWVKGRGEAAAAFGRLVAGIDAMQRRICDDIRIGAPYERLHDASHVAVAGVLRDVGIVKTSVEEAVERGVTRVFFPHGLGHSLGLQTHDVGCALRKPRDDNRFLRNTADVASGQVFTIEPGVYFIESLLAPLRDGPEGNGVDWRVVEMLAPLGGVRIEDDVHVAGESKGVRNLTREQIPDGGGRA